MLCSALSETAAAARRVATRLANYHDESTAGSLYATAHRARSSRLLSSPDPQRPRHAPALDTHGRTYDAQVNVNAPGGKKVLVVDDLADSAESLAVLVRAYGHEVRTAFSGEDALAALSDFCADIAFLDIGMPFMDGCQVAKAIRARSELKDIYLVALTGRSTHKDLELTRAAGFDIHVLKPPTLKKLEWVLSHGKRAVVPELSQ